MTDYQGYYVLEVEPHREDRQSFDFNRPFSLLDNEIGRRLSEAHGVAPSLDYPFTWIASGRAQIQEMRDFLLARKGRAVPFWVPSYQRDLRPVLDPSNGSAQLTIRRVAYTSQMFVPSGARRHLAIYEHPGAAPFYRKVTTSAEDVDTNTEVLGLDANFADDYLKDRVVVSFLVLCRMTNDSNDIQWLSRDVAKAEFKFTEVPREAPT